jgi:putative SOS response-associated peptidase YedK
LDRAPSSRLTQTHWWLWLRYHVSAIIRPDEIGAWLGEELASVDELKAMLKPYPSELMWPVDKRVGNVQNEGRELAEPVMTYKLGGALESALTP